MAIMRASQVSPRPGAGFSAVEVMVAVMVAATIGIPLLTLLFQERDSEQRARFEYLAILAARDAAYEARALVACGVPPASVAHGFKALEGNPLDVLKDVFQDDRSSTTYSPEQKRVTLEVKIEAPTTAGSRAQLGTVTTRWVDPELAKLEKRRTTLEFSFGVLKPPGSP